MTSESINPSIKRTPPLYLLHAPLILNRSSLKKSSFIRFQHLLLEHSGIVLKEGKQSLLTNRIQHRMKELGLRNYDDYLDLLESERCLKEKNLFINSLSTNLTSFYRENHHFDHFSNYLVKTKISAHRLRIWSSACSTGQEAYNIAFILHQHFGPKLVDSPNVLATDVNEEVLATADLGIYDKKSLAEVPNVFIKKSTLNMTQMQISKSIRDYILFKKMDLSKYPFHFSNQSFHVIFCRNVMIYFNHQLKQNLLNEFYRMLHPGGILYLGHADTLGDLNHSFKMVQPSIYMK